MYRIYCKVSGGVTGTREAYLKGKDGQVQYFDTREEAQAALPESRISVTGTQFTYRVEEAY